VVVRSQENAGKLDLDRAVSRNTTGGCLRGWRPQRGHLPAVVERCAAVYRTGTSYSDFWRAYQAVIPDEQHQAVGKETGETAHVERWNTTLRQRLGRFVRKTVSFSKSVLMHEICLRLFLHRYNLEIAILRG
jgi:IS1 family transposase